MKTLENSRILLVNDDGIVAPGMSLLEQVARGFTDDVWVVAPDDERSGAGRSLSITTPVRVREIDDRHFAVRGTPTDCVVLAVHEIMRDAPPDLILSGINRGSNLAEDVSYSGTAAAAMEGVALGIPSIALSLVFTFGQGQKWETAEQHAPAVLRFITSTDWEPGLFYNVNFPDCAPESVTGMRITRQGTRGPGSFIPERRIDGRDVPYYWIKLDYKTAPEQSGSDLTAIDERAISISPMHMDFTRHDLRDSLSKQLQKFAPGS